MMPSMDEEFASLFLFFFFLVVTFDASQVSSCRSSYRPPFFSLRYHRSETFREKKGRRSFLRKSKKESTTDPAATARFPNRDRVLSLFILFSFLPSSFCSSSSCWLRGDIYITAGRSGEQSEKKEDGTRASSPSSLFHRRESSFSIKFSYFV